MADDIEQRTAALEQAIIELFKITDDLWFLHGRQPQRWSFKSNDEGILTFVRGWRRREVSNIEA
jgi:hypothetical protein